MKRPKRITSRENGRLGGRPSALSDDKSLSAQNLFYAGVSIGEIARRSGLPISTLYRYAKAWTQKELKIGVSCDSDLIDQNSRFSSENCQSELKVIQALCTSLKARPVFVRFPFANLLGAVERSEVDIGLSALSPTEDRKRKVHFTGSYTRTDDRIDFFTLRSSRVTTLGQIFKGKFGALKGTQHEEFLKSTGFRTKLFKTDEHLEEALCKGQIDALLSNRASLSPRFLEDAVAISTPFPLNYGLRPAVAVSPRFQEGESIANIIEKMNSVGLVQVIDELHAGRLDQSEDFLRVYDELLKTLRS